MISVPISWKLCTKLIIIYIPRELIDCRAQRWPFRENTGVPHGLSALRTSIVLESKLKRTPESFFSSRRYYLIMRQLDARVFIFNYAAKKRASITTNRESISSDLSPFLPRITRSHPNYREHPKEHPKEQRLPAVDPSQFIPLTHWW